MVQGSGPENSEKIASALANHERLRTHARPLDAPYLKSLGMKIDSLEADQQLQDKVLTIYHAAMHTFSATAAIKIIENQHGRAFIKVFQQVVVQPPLLPQSPQVPSPQPHRTA